LPTTRILLLGNAASDAIARVLAERGRAVTRTENAEDAIRAAADHEIVVIDQVAPPATVATVCRDIRAVPELAELPILAVAASHNVEERIRLLESGADDVMARPVDERELEARIEALSARLRRSKEGRSTALMTSTRREGRRLIVVFSPKGGVGTTTVAVNLTLAVASREPGRVAIVDMAPGAGSVATHLNVEPRVTLADLARDSMAIGEPDALRAYLTQHDRLFLLAGESEPGLPVLVTNDNAGPILETVLSIVPTVIVDAGSQLDARTMNILELADNVVFVVIPEFAALKLVHGMLEHFHQVRADLGDSMIVINELFARQMLTPRDIEGALGRKVGITIPHDPLSFQKAVNEGAPVYASARSSAAGQRFDELAGVLLGEDAPGGEQRRRRGLFRR
jgi:pilus assembly protein CpaE